MAEKMRVGTCLGFGGTEGKCANPAGTKWSPYWCEECNKRRMEHITKQLNKIAVKLQEAKQK